MAMAKTEQIERVYELFTHLPQQCVENYALNLYVPMAAYGAAAIQLRNDKCRATFYVTERQIGVSLSRGNGVEPTLYESALTTEERLRFMLHHIKQLPS